MKIPTYEQNPGAKAYSGFGRHLLQKMGWEKGQALGVNPEKGLKEALEVEKKEAREGVGKKKERYNWEEKWWEGHFKSAAEKFALAVKGGDDGGDSDEEKKKKKKEKKKKKKKGESS